MKVALYLVPAIGLALSGCLSKDNDDVNPPAQTAAAAPVASSAAQAPADAATMLALTAFTVVDQNGIHSGTFRNIDGTSWTGPDLVRGGTLRLQEVFKRGDQMILEAVRREPVDDWNTYEVSIQANRRVYITYRYEDQDRTDADIPDHTAVDLRTQ